MSQPRISVKIVIYLQKKAARRNSSFREKLSDTFNDTLRKKKRCSRTRKDDATDFLFINKPDFYSSEESLTPGTKKTFNTVVTRVVNVKNAER